MTPNTSRSRRIRVTVSQPDARAIHQLSVESGYTEAREASALLKLGILHALRRYAKLYGDESVSERDVAALRQFEAMLGYDNKPAEGEHDIAQPPGP